MNKKLKKLDLPENFKLMDSLNRDISHTQKMLSGALSLYPLHNISKVLEEINKLAKIATINMQPFLKQATESQELFKKIMESIPKIEIPKFTVPELINHPKLRPLSPISKAKLEAAKTKKKTYTEDELLEIAKRLISLEVEKQIKIKNIDTKNKFPYPLPKTTNWESIIIKFKDRHFVQTMAGGHIHVADYNEMGFKDGRKLKPNLQWLLLETLSKNNGETAKNPANYDPNLKKKKQLLAKGLKKYFGLSSDPFYPFRKEKMYKIKIDLVPESQSINSASLQISTDTADDSDDNLGINDFYQDVTRPL
jgi:hypothetical protein